MSIRVAKISDAKKIKEIYDFYVTNTTTSFEIDLPTLEDMSSRIEKTLKKFPYLVYEIDGEVIGYAYATDHIAREAYGYNAVLTVYLKDGYEGKKLGMALYQKLFDILKVQGYCNLYGCISGENISSIKMHEKMGFLQVALFEKSGYKFGRWVDMTWLAKRISDVAVDEITPFSMLDSKKIEEMLKN